MRIGIDIGGTNTRIGFNENNKIVKSVVINTEINDFKNAIANIANEIKTYCKDKKIEFIGIGCPGPFKPDSTTICNAPNMGDWNNNDPKNEMQKHFMDTKIIFINDANLQGINEYQQHSANPFIFLTFSTGIGGVVLIDGKVLNGFSNTSMEIANAIPDYKYFNDLNKAGIEFFCSGKNIPLRLQELGLNVENAKQGFELYEQKHPVAIKYFEEYKNKVVQFLVTLIYIINPENIVLNGPLVQNYQDFFNTIIKETKKLADFYNAKVNFIFSKNDLDSVLLTASKLDLI